MVLFEAMSAGVTIVATQVGGVRDVLSPTEAFLVSPEDPAALAAAVLNMYCNRAGANARAQATRERLLVEFHPAPRLTRYETLYQRIQKPLPGRDW